MKLAAIFYSWIRPPPITANLSSSLNPSNQIFKMLMACSRCCRWSCNIVPALINFIFLWGGGHKTRNIICKEYLKKVTMLACWENILVLITSVTFFSSLSLKNGMAMPLSTFTWQFKNLQMLMFLKMIKVVWTWKHSNHPKHSSPINHPRLLAVLQY